MVPIPHDRVERVEQGPGIDRPGNGSLGVHEQGLVPPLDLDLGEGACGDQGSHHSARLDDRLAVVIGETLGRADHHPLRRAHDQFPQGIPRRHRRGIQVAPGDHPLGHVVVAGEVAPLGHGRLAAFEEPLEDVLSVGPPPPRPGALPRLIEVGCGDRATLLHLAVHRLDVSRCLLTQLADATPRHLGVMVHAMTPQRPVLDGEERRHVRPVLEHPPLPQSPPQEVGVVGADAGEERQLVGPFDDVDRVDLQHAHPPDRVEHPSQVGSPRRAR